METRSKSFEIATLIDSNLNEISALTEFANCAAVADSNAEELCGSISPEVWQGFIAVLNQHVEQAKRLMSEFFDEIETEESKAGTL